MARSTFLTIEGRLFVIGLAWGGRRPPIQLTPNGSNGNGAAGNTPAAGKPVPNTGRGPATLEASAALRAAETGATHAVIRKRARQFGLATVAANTQPTFLHPWYAGAAAIADQHPKNTIGAWMLPDGRYWVLEIGSNGILPEGDAVFDSEHEARAEYEAMLHRADFRTRYAPAHWNIEKAQLVGFQELLHKHHGPKLRRPSKGGISINPTYIGLGVGVAVGAIAIAVMAHKPAPKPVAINQGPPPQLNFRDATATLMGCLSRMTDDYERLIRIPLYTLTSARCEAGTVTYTLVNGSDVRTAAARSIIATTYIPDAKITPDRAKLELKVPTAPLEWAPRHNPEDTIAAVTTYLRSATELLLGTPNLPPQLPGVAAAGGYQSQSWIIETEAPAPYWAPILATPYADITTVQHDYATFKWTITGITYGR